MEKKYLHSDDASFEAEVKSLLLFRKIVEAKQIDDQSADLILDNGTVLEIEGNQGCGGCHNGWYYIDALNSCDNAITNVECTCDGCCEEYHIYVFVDDQRINCLQVSGYDNGYYGTGYHLYVTIKE